MLFGDRFPHASRNMVSSSSSRVKDLESVKPVISYANDIMTPVGEHSTKEFITGYGDRHPAHGEEDGMNPKKEKDGKRINMNIIYGDENACRSTLETIDDKPDPGEIMDIATAKYTVVSDDDDVEYADYGVSSLMPFPNSRHRDGSIYMIDWGWKKDFHIADRDESKLSMFLLLICY